MVKIAVWKTGHEIADTVAQALAEGFDGGIHHTDEIAGIKGLRHGGNHACNCVICQYDVHIGYGILRGQDRLFRYCEAAKKSWLQLDRGYFQPSHFDGYYRISYRGTQAKYNASYPITDKYDGELLPIREYDKSKSTLVCPPTEAVKNFFGLEFWNPSIDCGTEDPEKLKKMFIVRHKDAPNPIDWNNIRAVITFNSSVGWEALRRGIPCLSHPLHSVVGSYYNTKSIDECIEKFYTMPRELLFNFMRSHQFTLDEIKRGKAWGLIKYYTAS